MQFGIRLVRQSGTVKNMALEVQPEEKNVSFEENSDKTKTDTSNTNVQVKEKIQTEKGTTGKQGQVQVNQE